MPDGEKIDGLFRGRRFVARTRRFGLEKLLDMLLVHRLSWVQDFLHRRQLPFSGDRHRLRERITGHVDAGNLTLGDFVGLLEEIEGWGNQHIYLYTMDNALLRTLADEGNVRETLGRSRCAKLFNRRLPLVLPDKLTLSSVFWTPQRLRFVWVEKRTWRERLPDEDRTEGDVEYDAYCRKESRGLVAFDCDLVAGGAELLIQRLPSGNRYFDQKQRFEKELEQFLDLSHLQEFRISAGIRKIDEAKEIRKRSTQLQTPQGSRIVLTSKSRTEDTYRDPTVRKARDAVGRNAAGRLGNFYWPSNNGHPRDIHVKLYAQDQRVGVFGECSQDEVRHVLSGVRAYCS